MVTLLAAIVAWFLRRGERYPFDTKPVLTEAELAFHAVLADCVPDDLILLAKVRLADFLNVRKGEQEFLRYFGKISQKHSDFLLIDAGSSEPVLAIELDDSTHRRLRRTIDSDQFKDAAYEAAGLPVLRVPAAKRYNAAELRGDVLAALNGACPAARRQRDLFAAWEE